MKAFFKIQKFAYMFQTNAMILHSSCDSQHSSQTLNKFFYGAKLNPTKMLILTSNLKKPQLTNFESSNQLHVFIVELSVLGSFLFSIELSQI